MAVDVVGTGAAVDVCAAAAAEAGMGVAVDAVGTGAAVDVCAAAEEAGIVDVAMSGGT